MVLSRSKIKTFLEGKNEYLIIFDIALETTKEASDVNILPKECQSLWECHSILFDNTFCCSLIIEKELLFSKI